MLGKSLQLAMLLEALRQTGHDAVVIHDEKFIGLEYKTAFVDELVKIQKSIVNNSAGDIFAPPKPMSTYQKKSKGDKRNKAALRRQRGW